MEATCCNTVSFEFENQLVRKVISIRSFIIIMIAIIIVIYSCSKGGGGTPAPPNLPNPCAGVTITVSATTANPTSATAADGSINASASGSSGFTFNINGGAFQSSGNFTNLSAGSYTIIAKNGSACTGSASFTLTAPNLCAGVTITVNNTATNTIPCETNTGTLTVNATGGTGSFTYSLNGTTFQSSNVFSGLAAGNYTVTAKDANGCSGLSSLTTVNNVAAGAFFSSVKTLIQNNCGSCHNATNASGGMDFSADCNIVNNKARIKARAVDGVPSPMPQGGLLPVSERQKITDWINAGGKFTN